MVDNAEKLAALSLLGSDEIDFSTLDNEMLSGLARGQEPYIATSALFELAQRPNSKSQEIATALLTATDDEYLRAAALRVLFEKDRGSAIDHMGNMATNCDPYVFGEMLDLMIENQSEFDRSPRSDLVQLVTARLRSLAKEAVDNGRRALFAEMFSRPSERVRAVDIEQLRSDGSVSKLARFVLVSDGGVQTVPLVPHGDQFALDLVQDGIRASRDRLVTIKDGREFLEALPRALSGSRIWASDVKEMSLEDALAGALST